MSRLGAEKLDMIVTGTAPVTLERIGAALVPPPAPAERPSTEAVMVTAAPAPSPDSVPVPVVDAPATVSVPVSAPAVTPTAASRKSAALVPKAPDVASGKRYRLQVGSYKLAHNAAEAFDRLISAGFSPAYERSGELYRVVLVAVPASDVERYAERLGGAGFAEALVREER